MAQQTINVGAAPNDGTGDPLQTAFTKSNANFTELYAAGGRAPQGRLTLQTATPVMTTTQSAKTTIYYTPYCGSRVPLYDGTSMTMTTFAELSNVTTASATGSAGPAAVAASSCYDLFVWSNAGTVTLTRGPAWTNDTTRSAGTALVMVSGVLTNAVAITNGPAIQRGTYVGTVRSNASSQIDWTLGTAAVNGGAAFLYVWNAYNRVDVATKVSETTATWSYGTPTVRAVRAQNTNRVSFVTGLAEDCPACIYSVVVSASASQNCAIGVGLDSTAAFSGPTNFTNSAAGTLTQIGGNQAYAAQLGAHFFQACEYGTVSAWNGDGSSSGLINQGLMFRFRM